MKRSICSFSLVLLTVCLAGALEADEAKDQSQQAGQAGDKVYGEWRIQVRADKGPQYNQLIEEQGLPLFREAGGRMVGWWNTLIGNLYEHVTIWEYDNMAAFEKAIEFLGPNEQFGQFVAKRDPLLAGEHSRFIRLTPGAIAPSLPEPAKFVIHETHRVPLAHMQPYLRFMEREGLQLLKRHGFRPLGPWVAVVGQWTEVTYLFRFETLAERERLIAEFSKHPDAETYGAVISEQVDEVTTRLLIPAPFARSEARLEQPQALTLLPHLEQVSAGVYAAGFADRYASANCGWVTLADQTLLVDLPQGVPVPDFLAAVAKITGQPARSVVLTRALREGEAAVLEALVEQGVTRIMTTPAIRDRLSAASERLTPERIEAVSTKTPIGDDSVSVDLVPLDQVFETGGAAVHLPGRRVLFAGPLVVNGPRTRLPGSDTGLWVAALSDLDSLASARVVPGFGSWGGAEILERQRRFLGELRRQVSYVVAQGRPAEALQSEIQIGAGDLVWMPYDTPATEDLEHVYRELTIPIAPFHGRAPRPDDARPHALVLFGDQPHEPGHVEEGLRPLFEATGVEAHFTVDVNALSAENLAQVQLLVILRDGLQRPSTDAEANYIWMTPEQERAVVEFVEGGGAFLNLHNSMGLYPDDGPYLKLVGGRYIGHGPLERFRVEVVDGEHPITRGVSDFSVADEQHTPPYNSDKVHLLLRNRSDDGQQVAAAGWAYEPGRGRLCHLANGHTRESLLHPMYQRLMRNAVHWCLRRE